MGGFKDGSFGGSVVQSGIILGTDVDLSFVALRQTNGAGLQPLPAGALLGEAMEINPELLGGAVALIMETFPGTELVEDKAML